MRLSYIFTPLLATLFFASCGENTSTSPIADVTSISIDDTNLSIYSTSSALAVTATATYSDGTTANATADLAWSSSDTSLLVASVGNIQALSNGGDANLTIDYADTFSDTQNVHIKELIDINISNLNDINISDIGTPQKVYFSGTFENNETNITLANNITWYSDENATISDVNGSELTLTVDYNTSSVLLRAILFTGTTNAVDFNKTLQ